ncbi:cilia- and flagella-associated protein 69-like isoform X1 [Platichthys flesus]|uniref:cilia- and flagella-associated protein 69-like isoform X1 n=1 Tax=Platichthys flesus TaxID=8260 RepID=UPI002DB84C85|nr:cilia- and flagella-associated protein 69-like isoform X1 [Platichthys flesus]
MDSGKVVQRKKPEILRAADMRQHQEVSAKSLDSTKVIRLLEDPLTANLKERHLFVLKKLLKRSQIGFLLKDLKDVTRILNICAEKVNEHPEYLPILCEALKICRFPFLKEKASDELNYAQDVIEFISHLGCLMRVSDAEVRQQIVETVKSFYNHVAPKHLHDGTDSATRKKPRTLSSNRFSRLSLSLQSTSPGYRLQLLELSDVAQTLLLSMSTLENQPTIKLQLLKTLQILSGSSDMNCALMLNARGAETICLHMNEPDPSGEVLVHSSEILWNLLERGSKATVTAQLSSMECTVSLKEAFFHQLMSGFQPSDLQLRNDLLVITTLIAEHPNHLLIESLFAKQLMVFVTFPELKTHNSLVRNFKLSYNSEDLKMKKMLLNLLVLMSKDLAALQLYREEQVMLALLTLVKPPAATTAGQRSGGRHWSSIQQEELQLQALATLATIAPLMLDEYMACMGNARLLLLLDWCTGQDSYFGDCHSFHGTGGRGSKKAQMRHCIRVLRSVTSLGEESVLQDLCDQGTISQLMGILMQMEASPDEEDLVTLEIKSDIQLILSALCENDMHRKELFGAEGVEMTVHFLKKGPDKFYSGLGHNKLILSTVDCVWSCIVGCYTTEDYFLVKEGVFLLLDLLVLSPRCVHAIVLATLLELCDNPNTLTHILSWRDEGGRTASSLLLQLWRLEEEELGVTRDQHGGIADPQRLVLRCDQEDTQLLSNTPSAAVMEISENLRSKIYSIFCKLGFLDLPGLSAKDYVTLGIIRRYLDFKVGEVWEEVSRELVLDGVRPISPDQESLSRICKIPEDTARKVMMEQISILEQQKKEEASEEEIVYTEIKSHFKQRELTAKSWDSYVSKTSNHEVLKEVKAQRKEDMESSRPKRMEADPAVHPAEHFIGQVIDAESSEAQAGVKLTMTKPLIQSPGPNPEKPAARDPELFSSVSVKDV